MLFPGATVFLFTLEDSSNEFASKQNSNRYWSPAIGMSDEELKNLNYSERKEEREGKKNWSNISTRRQQQPFSLPPPKKNNHSFQGPGSPEDSKFVSSPFFMELRENLLLLLDFGAPTWCSNQWERDLEQNSMPFLAAGDVALAHRLRERIFLEMSILAETWSGKNGEKARFLLLLPPARLYFVVSLFSFFFPVLPNLLRRII